MADAQKQRTEYLSQKAELQKGLRTADAQGREEIRAKLKEAREQFLAHQLETRTDLQSKIAELKGSLGDHADVIEQAKEQAKSTTKSRKDGVD